jgi:hypothetical protein
MPAALLINGGGPLAERAALAFAQESGRLGEPSLPARPRILKLEKEASALCGRSQRWWMVSDW